MKLVEHGYLLIENMFKCRFAKDFKGGMWPENCFFFLFNFCNPSFKTFILFFYSLIFFDENINILKLQLKLFFLDLSVFKNSNIAKKACNWFTILVSVHKNVVYGKSIISPTLIMCVCVCVLFDPV